MRKIVITLLAAVLLQACDKHHTDCPVEEPDLKNAVIWNTGKLEVDGCDWVVRIDNTTSYHADNLPDSYKVNDLNVRVSFTLTAQEFTCGWLNKLPIIHITHIQR